MTSEWTDEAVEALAKEIECCGGFALGPGDAARALRSLLAERTTLKKEAACPLCCYGVNPNCACGGTKRLRDAWEYVHRQWGVESARANIAERDRLAREVEEAKVVIGAARGFIHYVHEQNSNLGAEAVADDLTAQLDRLSSTRHLAPVTASAETGQEEPTWHCGTCGAAVPKAEHASHVCAQEAPPMTRAKQSTGTESHCATARRPDDPTLSASTGIGLVSEPAPASPAASGEEPARTGTSAPPLTRAEVDDGHLELGFRIEIAKARGELPGGEVSADSRAWADYADSLLKAGEENAALRKLCGEAADLIEMFDYEGEVTPIGWPEKTYLETVVAKLREAAKP